MTVTISQLRKDLFSLVERAADGDVVEFTQKGTRFRIVPEGKAVDKLSRIKPLSTSLITGDPARILDDAKEMTDQLVKDWESNWNTRLGGDPDGK